VEVPQGNSLCSYLKQQQQQKNVISFFSLVQNQKIGGKNRSCLGRRRGETRGSGEEVRKGYRRMNMVQILCIHDVNRKSYLLKLFQEPGGGE
jgi:hypothetical protein